MTYASNGTEISAGRKGLASYHNMMIDWYGGGMFSAAKYTMTFEELEKVVSGKNPNFLAELGQAVIIAKIGLRRLDEAMERVVNNTNVSPLTIPGIMTFQKGVTDEITEFDFSLLGDAGLDLAKVVAQKVEKVGVALDNAGTGILDTVSTAGKILPMVLIAIVGIIIFAGFKVAKNTKKTSDIIPKLV